MVGKHFMGKNIGHLSGIFCPMIKNQAVTALCVSGRL